LAGTQKTVTVGSDLKASVTYSRTEAKLNNVGDYVTVTYAGKTDYAIQRVDVVPASSTSKPKVGDTEITVARNDEKAYFYVTVDPKSGPYTGTLVAQRSSDEVTWVNVSVTREDEKTFLVPIAGTDFPADKEKLFYKFTAVKDGYTDVITTSATVQDPYFFLKKSAVLNISSGLNMLINQAVPESDKNAMLAASADLILQGGSAWLSAGNKIEFVPTTAEMYSLNNSNDAIAAFEAGAKATTASPASGAGLYIFNATTANDAFYGMIRVVSVAPSSSVSIEYRIGNKYTHLAIIE
jgi:hypothetical protein